MGFIHVGADGSGASLRFPEMLRVNTPTAGDTGAHVLLPRIIEEMGFRVGWPLGWSNAWFAGFPVLYLYFPLPMLSIVLLDTVLPYGVAFKMVHAAGLIALPAATYFMVRWIGFERIVAGLAAVAGGMFVFMESYWDPRWEHQVRDPRRVRLLVVARLGRRLHRIIVSDAQIRRRSNRGRELSRRSLRRRISFRSWSGLRSPACLSFRSRGEVSSSFRGFSGSAWWVLGGSVRCLVLQGQVTGLEMVRASRDVFGPGSPLPWNSFRSAVRRCRSDMVAEKGRSDSSLIGLAVIPLAAYFLLPRLGLSIMHNGRFLPFWYYGVFVLGGIGIGRSVVASVDECDGC